MCHKSIFLRLIFFAILLLAVMSLQISIAASKDVEAQKVVQELHEALLNSMIQSSKINIKARYKLLKPVIDSTFHIATMVQITSDPFWKSAPKSLRDDLVFEFSRLTAATYASQFNSFSGQQFLNLGEKEGPQDTTLINTKIITSNEDLVSLVYVIKKIKGKSRIIDVLLDFGISELAKKRSEYRKILKSSGVLGLTIALRNKSDFLLSK